MNWFISIFFVNLGVYILNDWWERILVIVVVVRVEGITMFIKK